MLRSFQPFGQQWGRTYRTLDQNKTTKSTLLLFLLTALYQQTPLTTSVPCDVEEPLKKLVWLKDKVTHYRKDDGSLTIMQAQHRGETVFSIEYVLGADARETTYYHCNGWEICKTSVTIAGLANGCGDLPNELTGRKMIYPEILIK